MKNGRFVRILSVLVVAILVMCIYSKAIGKNLPVLLTVQQQDNWCWAASSKAVLDYYGNPADQCQMANYAFGQNNCCSNITWPNGAGSKCDSGDYLISIPLLWTGVNSVLNYFGNINTDWKYGSVSAAKVQSEIGNNRPLIMSWNWTGGSSHALVIFGISNNLISFLDPWPGKGLQHWDYNSVVQDSNHTWASTLLMTTSPSTGGVTGKLHTNSATGPALPGGTVTCGGRTATTASDGTYSLTGIPANTCQLLSFSESGYVPKSTSVNIYLGQTSNAGDNYLVSVPGSPSVNPPGADWTDTPHKLSVSSSGATKIYYRMVYTTDGSTPADPAVPTPSLNSGSITGPSSTLQITGTAGKLKKIKLVFAGCNSGVCGPATGVLSYSINLVPKPGGVSGKLHDGSISGPGLSGATVSCGGMSATTASDGTYALSGIAAGSQTLSFSKSGYQSSSRSVTITGGQTLNAGDNYLVAVANPSLLIDGGPSSTRAQGGTFNFTGSHYTPSGTVILHLQKPDGSTQTLANVTANSSGGVSWSYTSGCTDATGTYSAWAKDYTSGLVSNTVIEIVTASSSCTPTLLIDGGTSSTKAQGGTFTLTGSNYTPNGTVSIINGTALSSVTATSSGTLPSWPWATDCTTATGTYKIYAIDTTGKISNNITAIVTASSSCNTTPPTNVQVNAPASGQTISGTFTFEGTAQDNSGTIQKMEFYIDSDTSSACTDNTPKSSGSTFSCGYNSANKSNGTHSVKAKAYDPSGNSASSTAVSFTINNGVVSKPNLTPYQPAGWSDKIVVSKVTGTTTDSTPLYITDTLYVDWAVINNGTAATAATFFTTLYVDGVQTETWATPPPLNVNSYADVRDYSIGSLSAGTHYIKIVTDTTNAIDESNEADNEYTKTITVSSSGTPPGSFTLTLTPECSGTTSQIRLNWTPSSGVSTYDVYRNGSLFYSGLTGTQFINTTVTAGTSYSYYVQANNSYGSTSNANGTQWATAPSNCGCTSPGSFTLSASPSWDTSNPPSPHSVAVTLSWSSSSNATSGYAIYRDGGKLANITGQSYLNDPPPPALLAGSTHSYYIVAQNSCGNTQSNTVPITLANVTATVSNTGSSLSLRSAPGYTSTKIASLIDGTQVTITGAPSGYTSPTYAPVSPTASDWWWYVNTAYGSGWVWGYYLY